jgi:hypothetical protein
MEDHHVSNNGLLDLIEGIFGGLLSSTLVEYNSSPTSLAFTDYYSLAGICAVLGEVLMLQNYLILPYQF